MYEMWPSLVQNHQTVNLEVIKKMEINLEDKAKEYAEIVERPYEEVLAELQGIVNQGFSNAGAVSQWKSNNKFQLGVTSQEFIGRVIGTEPERPVSFTDRTTMVKNYHFLVRDPDTGEVVPKNSSIWNKERIDEIDGTVEIGKVYKFNASLKDDGSLNRLRKIEEVDDDLIADIDEIPPIPLDSIADAVGENEIIRGWVGRVISDPTGPIAFEVSDMGSGPPLTIWFGGQYSKIDPGKVQEITTYQLDDEVVAYGYISQSSSDMRMNAVNVWKVGV